MSTARCVLIALDSSENSDRAFDWMMEHFYRDGDKILLAHVHQLPNLPIVGLYGGGAVLSDGYQAMIQESVELSRQVAEKYREKCEEKKIHYHVLLQTAEGTVGETICKLASAHHASTIIIGSRGLGAFRRTIMGSVSDYVLHHSHVPTTVVPPAIKTPEK